MMNKIFFIFLTLYIANTEVFSQESVKTEGQYRLYDALQTWRMTNNAASLSIDTMVNRGQTEVGASHKNGSYTRVQEGGQNNTFHFNTEQYLKIGQYLYGYGSAEFRNGRTKDKLFSDVFRTYNNTPYIMGSAVKGSYDNQEIKLKTMVGTIALGAWRYGLGINYTLGDLSRIRDPRSRSQLMSYRLTPAIIFSFNNNSIGLSGYYDRRKEKIGSLTMVNEDRSVLYYLMTGMENITATNNNDANIAREWVNHTFGADLSYGYKNTDFSTTNNIGIARGTEYIYAQYKYEPGRYYSYLYNISNQNRIYSESIIHQIDLTADFTQGYANEYRSELSTTRDPQTGISSTTSNITMEYKKRYKVGLASTNIHYRANLLRENEIKYYVGAKMTFGYTKNKYILDTSSLRYSSLDAQIEGGGALTNNKRLWIDVLAGYHHPYRKDLSLYNNSTDYAQNVLIPDMDYYRAKYFKGKIEAKYTFPLTFKHTHTSVFVKGFFDYIKTNNDKFLRTFGLSIGIIN